MIIFKIEILDIPVIIVDYKDMICWTHSPNAYWTTKGAYKTSMQVGQMNCSGQNIVITDQEVTFLNEVWKDRTMAMRVKTFT